MVWKSGEWSASSDVVLVTWPWFITTRIVTNSLRVALRTMFINTPLLIIHHQTTSVTKYSLVLLMLEYKCYLLIYSEERLCSDWFLDIKTHDHQARRRFVEWAQNEIAVVPDFHKRILFSVEAHFWLNGYVNKQNCRIWSEANPQVYVETPLHPEKLTVWSALWAGGILLQKR
ncbi:hypothetical protein TNCV_4526411 [Trichonephila clavipes]|nr:hypothetical protein TNCV_4526411 [Trichonephila clavipes]